MAEGLRIPVFLNGLARGCVPADHELFFSRARSQALKGADVALVIGVPMDFRLGFGAAFGEDTEIVVIDVGRGRAPASAGGRGGVLRRARADAGGAARGAGGRELPSRSWIEELRAGEEERRAAEREEFEDERAPLHPMRLYAELAQDDRPRHDHDRRRRRLRLLRGSRRGQLPARLLA